MKGRPGVPPRIQTHHRARSSCLTPCGGRRYGSPERGSKHAGRAGIRSTSMQLPTAPLATATIPKGRRVHPGNCLCHGASVMIDTLTCACDNPVSVSSRPPVGRLWRVRRPVMDERCCVCGSSVVKARHRCATCLRYLERNGWDRPVALTDRQRVRDEERRCSDRASVVVGSSPRAVAADRADESDTRSPTAASGDEHEPR